MDSNHHSVPDFFRKSDLNSKMAPPPYADTYKMDHSKRGIAVIFNHVNFAETSKCPRRDGSNQDRNSLNDIFQFLQFQVVIHNDLTVAEIDQVLQNVSRLDHSNSDCLVVACMSHGDDGRLFAKDRDYPTEKLWKYFNAATCPSLAGKPKLFFIQACRGTELHSGQTVSYVHSDAPTRRSYNYTIPIMADILIMYSTLEGYYSWRDPINGSYFIQALVKQLKNHHHNKDLLTILTFVNRQVAIDFTSQVPGNAAMSDTKQMSSIVSMLTRLVYFPLND